MSEGQVVSVINDGVFGKIVIKYYPAAKAVDIKEFKKSKLSELTSLGSILKDNEYDDNGFKPAHYLACHGSIEDDDNVSDNIAFRESSGLKGEGVTEFEALLDLYSLLSKFNAIADFKNKEKVD